MSNTPPPFQPPHGPQPGFGTPPPVPSPPASGPAGAPAWQAGPAAGPSSLQPGAAPPKSSKLPKIIAGVVVVAIVAVVAVLAFGGSDGDGSKKVSAKAAHEGLQTVLDDSSFDENGSDDLRGCPLGDLDDLYDAVAAAVTIDPLVADGVDEKTANEESDLPATVECQRFVEDESEVDDGPTSVFFQAVLDPPRDYEGYITDFAGDATDVTFDDSVQYNGGEVVMFCSEANEDSGFTGCDADWVDETNKIALNVFLGGSDVKGEDALTALKAVLTIMADNLADLAATGS